MRYWQYLRYIPFVISLIDFIRSAERDFPGNGTGPQKLAFVVDRFGKLVDISEIGGVISHKLAETLRDGAETIVNLLVGVMNETGGVPPAPPPATGDVYSVTYDAKPDDSLFQSGDRVYRSLGTPVIYRAERGADPELGAGGWTLDHVVA